MSCRSWLHNQPEQDLIALQCGVPETRWQLLVCALISAASAGLLNLHNSMLSAGLWRSHCIKPSSLTQRLHCFENLTRACWSWLGLLKNFAECPATHPLGLSPVIKSPLKIAKIQQLRSPWQALAALLGYQNVIACRYASKTAVICQGNCLSGKLFCRH